MSSGRNSTIGAPKLAETHSVNGPKIDRHSKQSPITLGKHGFPKDSSKKSLSFFPEGDYTDQSSEESEEGRESERASYKNLNRQQQSFKGEKFPTRKDEVEIIQVKNSIMKIDSAHHNDASSTSSCSCEDHSSAGSQIGEDPHGDLDYDDDDDVDDEKPKSALAGSHRVPSDGPSYKVTVEIRSPQTKSNDLQAQVEDTSLDTDKKDVTKAETISNLEEDSSDVKLRPNGSTKKIISFINLDHRHEDDIDSDGLLTTTEVKKASKDRSHKSYKALLRYFFKDACYFQIKSINRENVELSKSMGVWSTPVQNEIRLNAAFRDHRNVILIFSVQQSGAFQGFARIVSESKPPQEPIPWILPERLRKAALGGVFRLEWLCTQELNFNETRDLFNPFNDNKPIKVARDGQQVEPKTGKKLCSLFPKDSKKRLLACVETLKNQSRQRKELLRESSYYPLDNPRIRNGFLRRPRNGVHSRLDSSVANGFLEDPRGVDPYHASMLAQYTPMTQYVGDPVDFARRVGSLNPMMSTDHIHRPRMYPNQGMDSYQRPTFQDHRIPVLDAVHHDGHEQYYHGPRGSEGNPYMHHMLRQAMLDQNPRLHDHWTTAAANSSGHFPYRYHPYQRSKR